MQRIYKITAIGIAAAAAIAVAAAKNMAAENIPVDITQLEGFSASVIKNATIEDEGASYSGEDYISSSGSVHHPKWFEGDKIIKADDVYYTVEAQAEPEYYYSGSEDFSDWIDIGNTSSEDINLFDGVNISEPQLRTVGNNTYTYRAISKNGSMLINLKCSPDEVNYLTVRLWGDDVGDTILWVCDPLTGFMNSDNTRQPKRNSLVDRRDWVDLNYVSSSPQYSGGFIYATYEIPTVYTMGKSSVSLRLYSTGGPSNYSTPAVKEQREASRGIYDVYMTQSPSFEPLKFGTIDGGYEGNPKDECSINSSYDMEEQKAALYSAIQKGLYYLNQWQIRGDEAPLYMQGMITRRDWRNIASENTDWKNDFYNTGGMLSQNMTPLNMLELAADMYKYGDGLDVDKDEMLNRVVLGIDFLCRAQGSNGGFYSNSGWIGGPDRTAAEGNNLTGFGLRSAGEAMLLVREDLTEDILNEEIDSDADGEADKTRREAWCDMLEKARDYLITLEGGYGHAPNQDMANSIAALKLDTMLSYLGGNGMSKSAAGAVIERCFGITKNLVTSSYWVSPKGTILENLGSLHGGYSGDYGTNAIAEMSELSQCSIEYGYKERAYGKYLDIVYNAINHYYFEGMKLRNGEAVQQLYSEGLISNRNMYYPGTERYPIDIYSAINLNNDTALKIIYEYFTNQRISNRLNTDFNASNSHFEDNVLSAFRLYNSFDELINAMYERNSEDYSFIPDNEELKGYAWADEMARNVVIKDGDSVIYMALNWRNPTHSLGVYNTVSEKDNQAVKRNNLCRVHAKNGSYDQYGYAEMYTDGYEAWTNVNVSDGCMEALMSVNYGGYTVVMNSYNCSGSGNSRSFSADEIEAAAKLDRAAVYKDMISGKSYCYSNGMWHSGGESLKLNSNSTLVLKSETLTADKAVIRDGIAEVTVNNFGTDTKKVSIYTAEYDEDDRFNGVNILEQNIFHGENKITLSAENADKVFAWEYESIKPIG